MNRKTYDPLSVIPSTRAIRQKLRETRKLSRRLAILLELAIRLELASGTSNSKVVARG